MRCGEIVYCFSVWPGAPSHEPSAHESCVGCSLFSTSFFSAPTFSSLQSMQNFFLRWFFFVSDSELMTFVNQHSFHVKIRRPSSEGDPMVCLLGARRSRWLIFTILPKSRKHDRFTSSSEFLRFFSTMLWMLGVRRHEVLPSRVRTKFVVVSWLCAGLQSNREVPDEVLHNLQWIDHDKLPWERHIHSGGTILTLNH